MKFSQIYVEGVALTCMFIGIVLFSVATVNGLFNSGVYHVDIYTNVYGEHYPEFICLIIAFVIYVYYLFKRRMKNEDIKKVEEELQ